METNNQQSGEQLRDQGINRAIEHAEQKTPIWADQAYKFLIEYAKENIEFLAEDVRAAAGPFVPVPPSKRSWGGIFVRAAAAGYIKSIGYKAVNNPKAHKTPATLWQTVRR